MSFFDKKSKEVEELTEAEKEEFTELHDLLFDKDGTSRARWAVRSRDAATELKPLLENVPASISRTAVTKPACAKFLKSIKSMQ